MDKPGRSRALALDAWPALLALVLVAPLLTRPGHPLARDLVFVPHQPLTEAALGLGSAAPRAVPLDAIVALVAGPVDGGVLARLVLPLGLAAAGWGTRRLLVALLPSAPVAGQLLTAGFAVWNPFVVERLALGQWALLVGYAALPWLVLAAGRWRRTGAPRALAMLVTWLAAASITPTGGLLGSTVVLAMVLGRSAKTVLAAAICLVLQLPWLLASLLGDAAPTSDPDGVTAFAAGDEGPGGYAVALLGLGGIWDVGSVPTSRLGWWGVLTAVVVVAAVALTAGRLRHRRLLAVALTGLLLAALSRLPGGDDLLRRAVAEVPGAGLLRDSQKLLAPYALLAAVSLGAAVAPLVRRAAGLAPELAVSAALVVVPLPVVLLPDGAAAVWPTVRPVTYPAGFDRVEEILDEGPPGRLVTLPWRSYRLFSWGNGETSSDPAVRWFDREVVVSADLVVGGLDIAGEDPVAARVGDALARQPVAPALDEAGVSWALVYRDDPEAPALDLTGLEEVYADADMALYRVPGRHR